MFKNVFDSPFEHGLSDLCRNKWLQQVIQVKGVLLSKMTTRDNNQTASPNKGRGEQNISWFFAFCLSSFVSV